MLKILSISTPRTQQPRQRPDDAGPSCSGELQIKAGATLIVLVVCFLVGRSHVAPGQEAREAPAGFTIVLRTAPNLADPAEIPGLVHRLKSQRVSHVLLQLKQDETHEELGGTAFYPSAIAPVAAGYGDDRVAGLIDQLDHAGIRVSGWLPALYDPAAAQQHPEWRSLWINAEGQAEDQLHWLCPRSEDAVMYETRIITEVATRYPKLSGIYTDFIRYDSDYSCVCPRCMHAIEERTDWMSSAGRPLNVEDIRHASSHRTELWDEWVDMRAESICDALEVMRDGLDEARQDMWFGACVLPFSAADYSFNTQAGQDLYEMARVGLDEIVLMGYWDDWNKSPRWLAESIAAAHDLVRDECELTCLLDGDMSVWRTRRTLEAAAKPAADHGVDLWYFNYGSWSDAQFARLQCAIERHRRDGRLPPVAHTAVVIRIDTEPDDQHRYDTVQPGMIRQLMDMLEAEGVRGTFITCGRLAELQPDVITEAARRGHEIGVHAYDHEQIDSLPEAQQIAVVDRGIDVFKRMGIPVVGFAAPRNSITDAARNRLIEHGLLYDGSAAFDPPKHYHDAMYASHTANDGRRILVIPFIMPNDYDARKVWDLDTQAMFDSWKQRLSDIVEMGEPCFVLDIHQWLATKPDNLEAVRQFIRVAKANTRCRVVTLAEAAQHAAGTIERVECDGEFSEASLPAHDRHAVEFRK